MDQIISPDYIAGVLFWPSPSGPPVLHSSPAKAAAVILLAALAAAAQDPRPLRQPHFPPAAIVLRARRHGPAPLPARPLDTARIQSALDRCPPGRAVVLRRRGRQGAFLSGPLRIPAGVVLRIGRGVTLYATRNPRLYDRRPGSCGVVGRRGDGCQPLILVQHAPGAGVMGPGTIDGQGGQRLLGQAVSWWALAARAKRARQKQNCPRLLWIRHSNHFTLYRLRLTNAPNFHVLFSGGRGFTAWGVVVDTPATARNTDGIDVESAQDASIVHCYIHDGDDDVAIKAGPAGPSRALTVAEDHFYAGHGMSIGSETNGGVSAVLVKNLTLDGTANGLRIKSNASRGGLVTDVVFQNICLRHVRRPIVVNAFYPRQDRTPALARGPHPSGGSSLPVFRDIVFRRIVILGAGRILLAGDSASDPARLRFNGVFAARPRVVSVRARNAQIRIGPAGTNLSLPAAAVRSGRVRAIAGGAAACHQQFVPLPASAALLRPSPSLPSGVTP